MRKLDIACSSIAFEPLIITCVCSREKISHAIDTVARRRERYGLDR